MTGRTELRVALVASLAALLATAVLAGTAAGAAGSMSTGSPVAEETTTHEFLVDGTQEGPLEGVEVAYRSDVGLENASVTVGVDRDGDGVADERFGTADVTRGDRSLRATVDGDADVTASDRVVVVVRGVENPPTVGDHAATVGATVDGALARSAVTYRVTPFRSDDSEFRDVAVPDSTFERTYATGSTVVDTRLVAADWRGVTLDDAALDDVRGIDDQWRGVEFADTTARTLRTERTEFAGVGFSGAALSDVRSTDDRWADVSVRDSRLEAIDSSASTYRDVRFQDARVTEFTAESSTLDGVSVRPADPAAADDGNRSDATAGADDGNVTARFALDGPSPDDNVDAATDGLRGDAHAPDGTVSNVTLRNAALRNVTLMDSALVDVRVESAALANVTFENVTLRGVTLSGDSYSGTLSDEVITSEAELERQLLVEEANGAASDGDPEASVTADSDDGEVETGGTADGADDGPVDL